MVLKLLSSCGVLKPTSLDLDPLACGDLGLQTHTYGGMLEPLFMGSLVSLQVWVLIPYGGLMALGRYMVIGMLYPRDHA